MPGSSTSRGGDFFAPLSGPVVQWFDWIVRKQGEQFGFINIYNVSSADREAERRIIEDVGSYGRQLGWVIEALKILVKDRLNEKQEELTSEQTLALQRLAVLAAEIEKVKQRSATRFADPFRATY